MKVVDLCCGAGLFSEGFRQAGYDIIYGVDFWLTATQSFKLNHTNAIVENKNVLELTEVPKCDVIIGSPPCQALSIQRYASLPEFQQQFNQSIITKFFDLAKVSQAKYIVFENTPQIRKYFNPNGLAHEILDAQYYGVPQRRKRMFFGIYPIPDKSSKIFDVVAPTITAWELCGGWKADKRGHRFSKFLNRRPTINEMKYYMGIPETYQLVGKQKDLSFQIGNAVCPPVAKAIATKILEVEKNGN